MQSARGVLQEDLYGAQQSSALGQQDYPAFTQSCAQSLLKIREFTDFAKDWHDKAKQFETIMNVPASQEAKIYLEAFKQEIKQVEEAIKGWKICLEDLFHLRVAKSVRRQLYASVLRRAVSIAYLKVDTLTINSAKRRVQAGVDQLIALNVINLQLANLIKDVQRVKNNIANLDEVATRRDDMTQSMRPGYLDALRRESLFGEENHKLISESQFQHNISNHKF